MFGNSITDFVQEAIGSYGYIVAIDLQSKRMEAATCVQMEKAGALSTPVTAGTTLAGLFALPESAACPDLAWHQAGSIVHVFLKTATYAYAAGTHIAIAFSRTTIPLATVDDNIDVRPAARELFKGIALQIARGNANKRVEFTISQGVISQKAALNLQ